MAATGLVVTYHSVSDGGGPTCIPPDVFAMQMQCLADADYRSWRLDEFIAWHDGSGAAERRVLITFDDGFADFDEVAAPILKRHGFTALVFVPTARLGSPENWAGAPAPARRLMTWADVRRRFAEGTEFGGHSRTHANLARLTPSARDAEIAGCADELATELGARQPGFAAPYGAVDPATVAAIGGHFRIAFGTRLAPAVQGRDRFDIPRIDMHYFRDARHWRGLLEGRTTYLRARQLLRGIRERFTAP